MVRGIVFRRSIRSSYATLDLVVRAYDDKSGAGLRGEGLQQQHVVILVQFSQHEKKETAAAADGGQEAEPVTSSATHCRSYFRRSYKLGDEVEVLGQWLAADGDNNKGYEKEANGASSTQRRKLELIGFTPPAAGSESSPSDNNDIGINLIRRQVWDKIRCQEARAKFYPLVSHSDCSAQKSSKAEQNKRKREKDSAANIDDKSKSQSLRHGGGIGKRKQGEIIADFLIDKISSRIEGSRSQAITYLNSGSGVIDAAGGSGHVSLALGLRGVRSTVVDPRPTAGRLPKRDRKSLRMAIRRHREASDGIDRNGKDGDNTVITLGSAEQQAHPPIQFCSLRAWFASKPDGVDITYREGTRMEDEGEAENGTNENGNTESSEALPICHMCSLDRLLPTCKAIVGLHPDEATGCIVEFAVENRIPFVVVPCCVFSRIFSNRFKPMEGPREIVSTYEDLVEWLVSKDPSIRVETLPFEGANKAVWSIFANDN